MSTSRSITACVAAVWLLAAPVAGAQSPAPLADDGGAAGAGATESELASGEVRRIDKAQQKITLRHGEIRSLDMPPMSMVFRVGSADLLDAVAVGDKVLFSAIKDADGSFVVTAIRRAP